jgi:hypothetical protein
MPENQPISELNLGMDQPLPPPSSPVPPMSQIVDLKTGFVGDSAEHLNLYKNEE